MSTPKIKALSGLYDFVTGALMGFYGADGKEYPGLGGGALGPYADVASLQAANPASTNIGKHATVNGVDYVSNGVAWVIPAGTSATLRNVATRCRPPTNIGGGTPTAQARSRHQAQSSISSLQVVYSNWYNNGSADVNVGSTCSIECAVEYPVGVFTRITFGGINAGVIPNGGDIISDAVAVTIPRGAFFFLRPYVSGSLNVPFCTLGNGGGANTFYDTANGERSEFGAAVVNHVMGGTIADMLAGIFLPSAIIALSDRPSLGIIGDSRTGGLGDAFTSSYYGYIGEFERVFGPLAAFQNFGINGESASNFATANRAKSRALVAAYSTHLVADFGGDIRNGATPASALASLKLGRDAFPLMPMFVATISPVTTSTDGWVTTTNQTVTANETNRTTYNTSLLQGQDFAGVVDIAGIVDAGSGKWKPFYTADGTHANQIGSQIMAASGLLKPGILV